MAQHSQTAQEVASQRAAAVLAAQIQAIQAEQARREQAITGYSQAGAKMLQSVAPQIQGNYDQAAARQATIAKGFSDGFRMASQGNADQANALLAKQGSPQQVQSAGQAGGDALYGLGGYIPASTMNREGAAFSSAAAMLPATQLGQGLQALTASQQDYGDKVAQIEAQRPGLIQTALADIRQNNLERRKMTFAEKDAAAAAKRDARDFGFKNKLYEQEYGLKQQKFGLDAAKAQASVDQRAEALRIQRLNARTAQGRLRAQVTRDLRRLGIDDEKLAQGWAALELRAKQTKGKKGGGRTLSPKQRADFRGTANTIAEAAFSGLAPDPTVPGDEGAPPIGYQDALREMYKEGIPLAVAQAALNQHYRPGQRGRPVVSFQERQRRTRASQRQSQGARKAPR